MDSKIVKKNSFNSTLVQLKASGIPIKIVGIRCFNSTLVQLKAAFIRRLTSET